MAFASLMDIKKHLGPGLGLRTNKFTIEIPLHMDLIGYNDRSSGGLDESKIVALCMSTSLPERKLNNHTITYRGRKYQVRGVTDYGGTWTANFSDSDNASLREFFDSWCFRVNDSALNPFGGQSSADIYQGAEPGRFGWQTKYDPSKKLGYQADIIVWQNNQLQQNVYGYKLQNAFPITVGTVEVAEGESDKPLDFSVTFAFSEFIPVRPPRVKTIAPTASGNVAYEHDVTNNLIGGAYSIRK